MRDEEVEKLEQEFSKAQEELIESFKSKIKSSIESVLCGLYTDVGNSATTDAHTNYYNYLKSIFRDSIIKEVASESGHYSWAHGIRMELLKNHPEAIQCKIIDDLQETVKSLESHIEQLRRFI